MVKKGKEKKPVKIKENDLTKSEDFKKALDKMIKTGVVKEEKSN